MVSVAFERVISVACFLVSSSAASTAKRQEKVAHAAFSQSSITEITLVAYVNNFKVPQPEMGEVVG